MALKQHGAVEQWAWENGVWIWTYTGDTPLVDAATIKFGVDPEADGGGGETLLPKKVNAGLVNNSLTRPRLVA